MERVQTRGQVGKDSGGRCALVNKEAKDDQTLGNQEIQEAERQLPNVPPLPYRAGYSIHTQNLT